MQPLDPATPLRGPLVVLVPAAATIWGREAFAEALASDSSLTDLFSARLETELGGRVRLEQVEVQLVPASLDLTRQVFKVVERRQDSYPRADLPAPGTAVQVGGAAPPFVVFLSGLELRRVRRATGMPSPNPRHIPGTPAGVPRPGDQVNGVQWQATAALWDNQSGAPVAIQSVEGWGAIGDGTSTMFRGEVSAETWAEAAKNLAASIAEALQIGRPE